MVYEETVVLDKPFDEVVEAVRDALGTQGFGVLSEIDLQGTLNSKVGANLNRYTILGACNPHLAYRAIQAIPEIGVLLPCNVVVRETESGVAVEAMDPGLMATIAYHAEIQPVADEARLLIGKALSSLL